MDLPLPLTSTTAAVDRRKHAAANRAQLACLPCRQAKHKCDGQAPATLSHRHHCQFSADQETGVEADIPCPRCAARRITCVWLPRRKTGRRPLRDSPHVPLVRQESSRQQFALSSVQIGTSSSPALLMALRSDAPHPLRQCTLGSSWTSADALPIISAPSYASLSSYATPFESHAFVPNFGTRPNPVPSVAAGAASPRPDPPYDLWLPQPPCVPQPLNQNVLLSSSQSGAGPQSTKVPLYWPVLMGSMAGVPGTAQDRDGASASVDADGRAGSLKGPSQGSEHSQRTATSPPRIVLQQPILDA